MLERSAQPTETLSSFAKPSCPPNLRSFLSFSPSYREETFPEGSSDWVLLRGSAFVAALPYLYRILTVVHRSAIPAR